MSKKIPVITIDGLSGTGKSILSKMLADELGFHHLNSGIFYRSIASAAISENIDVNDDKLVGELAEKLIKLPEMPSDNLFTPEVTQGASCVSALPTVRSLLIQKQRDMRVDPGLVADGRDMGTVIFPDADLKIFLTVSTHIKTVRRLKQLEEKGVKSDYDDVYKGLMERDKRDTERASCPAKKAKDGIEISNDADGIEKTVKVILKKYNEKLKDSGLEKF